MKLQSIDSRRKLTIRNPSENNKSIIIEYPTISNEDEFINKAQILSLYNEYVKSKENIQYIDYESPRKTQHHLAVTIQELNVHTRPQNKNLILKTQMRKFKNMALYDKQRLVKVKPPTERLPQAKLIQKHFSLQPQSTSIQAQTVNSYGRILLRIAYNKEKPKSELYFSKQPSPV